MAVFSRFSRPRELVSNCGSLARRLPVRWIVAIVTLAAIAAVGTYTFWPRGALPPRAVAEEVRFPLVPPGSAQWAAVNAFPKLKFFEPTCVVAARDGSGRVFVLERRGTIQVFQNDPQTGAKRQIVDFSAQVSRTPYEDNGALGLVLHPEFGVAGSASAGNLYVFYTAKQGEECFDRLSRFMLGADGVIDPSSELVLINQLDENLWHNGGALAFGDDGFLYVGVGDEGGDGDSFENGQRINKDLFSGILRIDVDRRGGDVSHPPPRQPASGKTAGYFIPNDNPFVGVPGALEEFWAIGFRNPHRIAFDPGRRRLWVGDVGQILREEIDLVSAGDNCGWSYREGMRPFEKSYLKGQPPRPAIGVETQPVLDYPHVNGNNCVIGGFVYQGDAHPDLRGKYIYADNGSGRIFALDYELDESGVAKVVSNVEIAGLPVTSKTGISSLAENVDGEIWIIVLGDADQTAGTIQRLVERPPGSGPDLPRLLSQTGIFTDVVSLTPGPGVIPYEVNSPLWSDGAHKRRWIILPGDGSDPDHSVDCVSYDPRGPWTFPDGTIFVKHFELPIDERDPSLVKRLETRVLVKCIGGGVYGVTYKWNDAGTDAELLEQGVAEAVHRHTLADGEVSQVWQFPDRQTCLVCHNQQAGFVLGVGARQLKGTHYFADSGVTAEQLEAWSQNGMFTEPLDAEDIAAAPRVDPIGDTSQSLEHRVMSYLDANCASCHRPGIARANFDARYTTPLADKGLIYGRVNTQEGALGSFLVTPGDPSRSLLVQRMLMPHDQKRMPPVAVERRDIDAIRVLCEWIDSLPVGEPPAVETPVSAPPDSSASESPVRSE